VYEETCIEKMGTIEEMSVSIPVSLNPDEFIPHEAGFPFGRIQPEIAQYPKST